jgi:endonuclease/exonuclease/phosphatase family metal-dependent hydrolase
MRRLLLLLALLLPGPAAAADLKLATWNIAWLTLKPAGHPDLPRGVAPRSAADFARLAAYAERLAADVVALQEIDGEAAAARVFPPAQWQLVLTDENDVQRPGFAIRRGLAFTRHADLAALDLTAGARRSLRRGADVTVVAGGASLRLLSVHLRASCSEDPLATTPTRECRELGQQAGILAEWIAARQREGVAFAVLGDLNRRFRPNDEFFATLAAAATLTAPTAARSNPCWSGGRGFIDHLLLGGAAAQWLVADSLRVLVYAERDPAAREVLSDHCPVSLRLRLP